MRASRAIASAAVGASALCVALVGRAQSPSDPTARPLTWRAPAGCPDEESVNAEVARLLAGSNAPLRANAEVERSGASWRVVVTMNGGVRRLEASSCRALAEATELIVAMAVDPARVARNRVARTAIVDAGAEVGNAVAVDASAPSTLASFDAGADDASLAIVDASPAALLPVAPVAHVETPPADAAFAQAPPAPARTTDGTTFVIQAAGTLALGTLPAPAIGPSIALAWTPVHFRFELSGAYFFHDSTGPIGATLANERFTMLTAAARACYLARARAFDLGPCLEVEVASVHGQGIVPPPSIGSSGSSAWVAPGAGLFAAWRVARSWAVFGRADALIPTIRPDFQVDSQTLHQPAPVTGRLSLGAELRF